MNKAEHYHTSRSEMLQYIPDNAKRILDVGCNKGGFSSLLKREDREIWGIELNEKAAKEAEKECNRVLCGDINELIKELPRNYFDCIVFNDILEHLYDPWNIIEEAKKILAPGGIVVSSIPNFRYISNIITEIIFKGEFEYKYEGGILDDTHIRFFTSKSIIRMYKDKGYEIIRHEGIRPCKSWKEKLFINLTFGVLKDSRYKEFATVAKIKK